MLARFFRPSRSLKAGSLCPPNKAGKGERKILGCRLLWNGKRERGRGRETKRTRGRVPESQVLDGGDVISRRMSIGVASEIIAFFCLSSSSLASC